MELINRLPSLKLHSVYTLQYHRNGKLKIVKDLGANAAINYNEFSFGSMLQHVDGIVRILF